MFDYKLLAALAAVIEQGGFERAAQVLGLSQSAISQRIKLLEARVGQPVLVRATPPSPTEVGRQLLNHVQQVRLLERDLQRQVPALDEEGLPERLRIALNADSLATGGRVRWGFLRGAAGVARSGSRRPGGRPQAHACRRSGGVPVWQRAAGGRRAQRVAGAMRYRALASPAFMARHFAQGFEARRLARIPAVVYGPDDFLQHRYLASLGIEGSFLYHLCPSSEGFLRMTEAGVGWGLVPELQAREQLASGQLVEICTDTPIDVPLYWHHWRNGGQLLAQLTEHLRHTASSWLVPL